MAQVNGHREGLTVSNHIFFYHQTALKNTIRTNHKRWRQKVTRYFNIVLITTILMGLIPPTPTIAIQSHPSYTGKTLTEPQTINLSQTEMVIPSAQSLPVAVINFNTAKNGWIPVTGYPIGPQANKNSYYSGVGSYSGQCSGWGPGYFTSDMVPDRYFGSNPATWHTDVRIRSAGKLSFSALQLHAYASSADPSRNWQDVTVSVSEDGFNWVQIFAQRADFAARGCKDWYFDVPDVAQKYVQIGWHGWTDDYAYMDAALYGLTFYNYTPDMSLSTAQTYAINGCPVCNSGQQNNTAGGPINTFSGNYNYQTTDLSLAAVGQPLRFERSYNSQTAAGNDEIYTRPLGYGWTHNYDLKLSVSGDRAIFKAPHGSRTGFTLIGGEYESDPGVWATLTNGGGVYTLTAANQETYIFNSDGYLTRHLDPQGNTQVFSRTNSITLTRVTDLASQRYLDFGYDPQGRLATVADPTGRQISYSYSANDDLMAVNDRRGFTWTYVYSGNTHLLYEVKDPTGKVVERTFYQDFGSGDIRANHQENGAGDTVAHIEYLPDNQRRITEGGRVITDTYNALNLLASQEDALGRMQNYTFDDHFNREKTVDARQNEVDYERDQNGLTHQVTNALSQTVALAYNALNHPVAITDTTNVLTTLDYADPANPNQVTAINTVSGAIHYGYNSLGQLTGVTNRRGYTTHYGYDTVGNLAVITDAKLNPTHFGYDPLGRLTAITATNNVVTHFEYDPGDQLRFMTENKQTGACDPIGCNLTTEYRYDAAGRLTDLIPPDANQTTVYQYDTAGRLAQVIRSYENGQFSDSQPDRDVATRYEYDSANRLRSIFERLSESRERETRITYDALSRVQSVSLNYQANCAAADCNLTTTYAYADDGHEALVNVTAPTGVVTRYRYDELNRLKQVTVNPGCAGSGCQLTTTYAYDAAGNLAALTDPLGVETRYGYDPLRRLTEVIEAYNVDGLTAPAKNVATAFAYDPEGNRLQTGINQQPVAGYGYDELNRPTVITDALNHAWTYGYNPVGNLTQIVNPKSETVNLQYDNLNRLTGLDYPGANTDVTFDYDTMGHRVQMADATGVTTYGYDHLNRPTQIVNPKSEIVNLQYDAAGNRTGLAWPTGQTITATYDGLDRPATVADWTSGRFTYTYSTAGQLTGLARPNQVNTDYGYDAAGRLITLTHRSGERTLAAYGYTLDAAGNIKTAAESVELPPTVIYLPVILKSGSGVNQPTSPTSPLNPIFSSPVATPQASQVRAAAGADVTAYLPLIFGGNPTPFLQAASQAGAGQQRLTRTLVYTYDNLSRLTEARSASGESYAYTYDARGNRLSQTVLTRTTVYTYDAANRLVNAGGQAYSWDNNGNLLNDGTRAYTYDAANRLASVLGGGITTTFEYNGDGDRTAQVVGGVRTDYLLDPTGLTQVLAAATGGRSTFYLPGLAQYNGSEWQYFLPDGLGSVRQVVDPARQVLLAQSFDPFGNAQKRSGPGRSAFGYTGEPVDPTGLVYLRARYYSPEVGRFLTADTIVPDPLSSMGWNRYAYVGNNPINYVDPSGHYFRFPPCPICDVEIDISDWPSWAQISTGIALTFAFAGNSPLHYDPYQQAIVGPTQYNLAVSTMVGFATPIQGEVIPGLGRPFRSVNSEFPPNTNLVDAMNNMKIYESTDCSTIAERLFETANKQGNILRVEPSEYGYLNLFEYGRRLSGQYYHEVYTDGQYIYDPRLSSTPIPKGDWERMLRGLNPGGISIFSQK